MFRVEWGGCESLPSDPLVASWEEHSLNNIERKKKIKGLGQQARRNVGGIVEGLPPSQCLLLRQGGPVAEGRPELYKTVLRTYIANSHPTHTPASTVEMEPLSQKGAAHLLELGGGNSYLCLSG